MSNIVNCNVGMWLTIYLDQIQQFKKIYSTINQSEIPIITNRKYRIGKITAQIISFVELFQKMWILPINTNNFPFITVLKFE